MNGLPFFRSLLARILLLGLFAQLAVINPVWADSVMVTITSSGPASSTVSIGERDFEILDFTISVSSDVTFDNFPISLNMSSDISDNTAGLLSDASGTPSNITDIKIADSDTGEVIFSPVDGNNLTTSLAGSTLIDESSDDNESYTLFTDDFSMSAGESRNFALMMDVANESALNGSTIVASLELSTVYPTLEDSSGSVLNNATNLSPVSAIQSDTFTFSQPSLNLALASSPTAGSNSYVKGSEDVPFVGINFTCGSAIDCMVTDMTVQGYFDDEGDASDFDTALDSSDHIVRLFDVVTGLWLEDASGAILSSTEPVDSSTYQSTFNSLIWEIPAGSSATLYVKGDLSSNAYNDGDAENVAFGLPSGAWVTAEDEDGNAITPSGNVNTLPTTYVTTLNNGSLTVRVDASTPNEDIVIAGAIGVELARYEFESTDESFTVTDISVNNYQSGIAANQLGDSDNNISSMHLVYEDEDGISVIETAYLVNGTAQFSSIDFYVPADDSAVLTVTADLNSMDTGTAKSGEFIGGHLAFNNFEAVANASGETLGAEDIDPSISASMDFDFGVLTYTNGDGLIEISFAQDPVVTLGSPLVMLIDNGASDNTNKLPVGSVVCVDDDRNGACSNEDVYVVQQWPSRRAGFIDRVTLLPVNDSGDDDYNDNDPFLYALPGQGFLTDTQLMHLYETKPILSLSSASPSGSRSVSSSDDAFVFTVEVDPEAAQDAQFRPSQDLTTCQAGNGTVLTSDANTSVYVDGSSCELTDVNTAGDSVLYRGRAFQVYDYASFWFRWSDNDANATTLLASELQLFTADANDGVEDNVESLSSNNVIGGSNYFLENTWYLLRDIPVPSGTNITDIYVGLVFQDSDTLSSSDDIYIDQFRLYGEKIELDIASDSDFDRNQNAILAYLRQGSTTVATGYVDIVPVDSGGDGVMDAVDGSRASILFIPSPTDGVLSVPAGTPSDYTVRLNTTDLLNDDAGVDDPVTFSIDLGSSNDGVVSPGDFYWFDSHATAQWLGDSSSSSLSSNTVKY